MKCMKKFLALMLAGVMTLGMGTVALADGETTGTNTSKAATYDAVIKTYEVTGSEDPILYPAETLHFTSVADTANPDGGRANLSIDDLTVKGNSDQKLTINVPSFNKVGIYHFTISETAGSTQGVTYTEETIAVSVMVEYDYNDTDKDGYLMTATVGITANEAREKENTFTNEYGVGSLAVTKNVTGNLGDTSKEFDVTVTFTSAKTVASAISYTVDDVNKTIAASAWVNGTASVKIALKDGETVTFKDIPDGVTYTVVEDYKSCNIFLELQIIRYYIYFDISSNALFRHNM